MQALTAQRLAGLTNPMERLIALLDGWLDFIVARPAAARIIQRLVADSGPRGGNPVEFSETALTDMDTIVREGIEAGIFRPISPAHLINAVASGGLSYICNAEQVGIGRAYDPADPTELAQFRDLLHRLARAAVLPD
jgi:TetR/AcrR family transcriptional regulator